MEVVCLAVPISRAHPNVWAPSARRATKFGSMPCGRSGPISPVLSRGTDLTMPGPDNITPMLYEDAVSLIRDGDVILYRVPKPVWWKPWTWVKPSTFLITTIGRSPYVHAGMAQRWRTEVDLLHTLQFVGGERTDLGEEVRRHPGQWDVYRPHQPYDGEAATKEMRLVLYRPYGVRNLFISSLRHTRIISRFLPPFTDDALNGSAPFCSQAVSRACRAGGRDPRPNHADIATEPGHLAAESFAEPVCRLYWDKLPEVV